MTENKFFRLVKYYFSGERVKKQTQDKIAHYESLDIRDLEYELIRSKKNYKIHHDIFKAFTKVVAFFVGASFIGILFKFLSAFAKTIPQAHDLTPHDTQIALITLGLFLIIISAICGIGLIIYRRYVNNLEIHLEKLNKRKKTLLEECLFETKKVKENNTYDERE